MEPKFLTFQVFAASHEPEQRTICFILGMDNKSNLAAPRIWFNPHRDAKAYRTSHRDRDACRQHHEYMQQRP